MVGVRVTSELHLLDLTHMGRRSRSTARALARLIPIQDVRFRNGRTESGAQGPDGRRQKSAFLTST